MKEAITTVKNLIQEGEGFSMGDMAMMLTSFHRDSEEDYLSEPAGQEHYYLLQTIANHVTNRLIIEYGTYKGYSAACLGVNPYNKVLSLDIENHNKMRRRPANISFEIIEEGHIHPLTLTADLIFLDTKHDGIFEKKLLDYLRENNYKGVVIMDDIHLSGYEYGNAMPDLWASINEPKEDLTHIGHHTGTGIIYFGDNGL